MSDAEKRSTQVRPVGIGGGRMGGGRMGTGEKAVHFRATLKKFAGYLRRFWLAIGLVVILAIASTVFTIVGPKILGNMTNQVVDGYTNSKVYDSLIGVLPKNYVIQPGTTGAEILAKLPASQVKKISASELSTIKTLNLSKRPGINFTKIGQMAILLIGLYLLSALFSFGQGFVMSGVTQKVTYQFRKDISSKINRMPLSYFDSRPYGEVLTHVTNDVDSISQSLNQTLTQVITSVATLIGITIMMLTISWKLTLVALITLPLSLGAVGIIVSKSQKYFKNQQDTLGNVNAKVEETYGAQLVVTAFNGQERASKEFQVMNGRLYNNAWRAQFLSGLTNPLTTFIGNLGYVGVAVVGGILAVQGTVSIGAIQAFLQYIRNFNQPISQVANVANVIQQMAASAERVFGFLGQPEESPEADNLVTLPKVAGKVEFDNVVFGYSPDQKIIKNFSAKVEPGQRIAIVGPTGAGKTTMVNLLMRFYEITGGSIKVDGVDIRSMKRSDVRQLFGMVLQDAWLFNGTIRDNIAYATTKADDKKVEAVAKTAHLDHFIKALPDGYDTVLDEEADNVSQGEKQLLTIARAMLENAPMLILDEATSSVDTRTEVLIQQAIDHMMEGKTSFVIAHRLSTIRDADLILVMNEGNVVEQGTHSELLIQNGFYASMYNSQFAPTAAV
jgi:ATP-binding cassette subfamily B multidrug efflux pump